MLPVARYARSALSTLGDEAQAPPLRSLRYTLCPVVDLHNHKGAVVSRLEYEYFRDRFVLSADVSREPGEQVWIGYFASARGRG